MNRAALAALFATDRAGYEWTPGWLVRVREDPQRRGSLLVAAALFGLTLARMHWLGLVVGGALVGLACRTVPGAVAGGAGFGVLVLVAHVVASPVMGPAEFLGLTPLSYVTVAAALVAPLWGSLARALV
jgi:hypothetical protein